MRPAAGIAPEKLEHIWEYETSPFFTDKERAALRVAQGAANVPNGVTDEDFAELRKCFSDDDIVDIVCVIAYFGFLNRWNDTMATELEDHPLQIAEAHLAHTGWTVGKHARES